MELQLTDWLASTEIADQTTAGSIADVGASLLQAGPTLPPAGIAEVHLRLAALRLLAGRPDLTTRHLAYAATMAFDMPAEAQLHILPRAIGLARTVSHAHPDASQLAAQVIDRGGQTLTDAMAKVIEAADRSLVELAALRAIAAHLGPQQSGTADAALAAIRQRAARVSLDLETAGELQLAADAARLAGLSS